MKKNVFALGLVIMIFIVPAAVQSELITEEYFLNISTFGGPGSKSFLINPFDTSLGTLKSVAMLMEANVDGAASIWSEYVDGATLAIEVTNTLGPVPEMGWIPSTVARYIDAGTVEYLGYEYSVTFGGSGNIAVDNIIFSDFGRFIGNTPFEIGLVLDGKAIPSGEYDGYYLSYTGNARIYYAYTYDDTPAPPVPEPISMLLFGTGIVGIGGYIRKKLKQN